MGGTLIATVRDRGPISLWLRQACVAGWTILVLTTCATRTPELPADELLRRLQAGEAVLECSLACLDAWRSNRITALLLDETRHWRELAILVMRIGYMNDLTYYYLGHASEGLGYREAAKTYYRISARLSAAGVACNTENPNFCNGQVFPAAAETRLAELTAPPPPPPSRSSRAHTAQHRLRRPPPRQAKHFAPARAHTTAHASTGTAVKPDATGKAAGPDFAAPPPVRR